MNKSKNTLKINPNKPFLKYMIAKREFVDNTVDIQKPHNISTKKPRSSQTTLNSPIKPKSQSKDLDEVGTEDNKSKEYAVVSSYSVISKQIKPKRRVKPGKSKIILKKQQEKAKQEAEEKSKETEKTNKKIENDSAIVTKEDNSDVVVDGMSFTSYVRSLNMDVNLDANPLNNNLKSSNKQSKKQTTKSTSTKTKPSSNEHKTFIDLIRSEGML